MISATLANHILLLGGLDYDLTEGDVLAVFSQLVWI